MTIVSVVIPTRDRPADVRRAVRSVLAQTVAEIEVVVVDDGSQVPVDQAALADGDPRVRVLRHDTSRGVSRARNAGCDAAAGEWVAYLDDDDFWAPEKLALQLECARRNDAGFVYTGAFVITPDGALQQQLRVSRVDDLTGRLLGRNCIGGPSTVMARTDAVREAGGFDPEISVIADWDMWLRLSRVTGGCAVPEPVTAIMAHAGSMQLTQVDRIRTELDLMRTKYADLSAQRGIPFGGSGDTQIWLAEKTWKTSRTPQLAVHYALTMLRHPRDAKLAQRLRGYAGRGPSGVAPTWALDQLAAAT